MTALHVAVWWKDMILGDALVAVLLVAVLVEGFEGSLRLDLFRFGCWIRCGLCVVERGLVLRGAC